MNINLWSRNVPRIIPQPSRGAQSQPNEATPPQDPIPSGEYDLLKQLDKTPANLSILELIKKSPVHQEVLMQLLRHINVSADLPASAVVNAILNATHGPMITFSDKDLAPPEFRLFPLTITLNGFSIDPTLVDTGASIHVCPKSMIRTMGIDERKLSPIPTTVSAYDNTKRAAIGETTLQLGLGPLSMTAEFLVMDIAPTYKAILGRPWIEATLGIPSTMHQCSKFPFNGKIIKVKSIPVKDPKGKSTASAACLNLVRPMSHSIFSFSPRCEPPMVLRPREMLSLQAPCQGTPS